MFLAKNIFFLNRKESCHGIINGKDEKNAQLQKRPHAACSVYTGALEREYFKAESFRIRFYLASTQLTAVHLGKFYKNLRQLVPWFKRGHVPDLLPEKFKNLLAFIAFS